MSERMRTNHLHGAADLIGATELARGPGKAVAA